MTLKELQDVLLQTHHPLLLLSNRVRWDECRSEDEKVQTLFILGEFVTVKDDLKDHVSALKQLLEICEAVAKGRYLEDRQRCNWGEHRCEYACTQPDEHCDSFDDRTPYATILDSLDECRPLRLLVKEWIVQQGGLQQAMREGIRQFFPDLKHYNIGVDTEGNQHMEEMDEEDFAAYDAEQKRQHESVVNRVEQYELNLERIRVICRQQGSLPEVAALITEGMPPQVTRPITLS
jgi:hypothetical protein